MESLKRKYERQLQSQTEELENFRKDKIVRDAKVLVNKGINTNDDIVIHMKDEYETS